MVQMRNLSTHRSVDLNFKALAGLNRAAGRWCRDDDSLGVHSGGEDGCEDGGGEELHCGKRRV